MKRKIVLFFIVMICFILQITLCNGIRIAYVAPNLLIIITSAFGFMKGRNEGLFVGLLIGFFIDIYFGDLFGVNMLIFAVLGYVNGMFRTFFFQDDIKLPMVLAGASDFAYNLIIFIVFFFLKGKRDFGYYLGHTMIPELIYTVVLTLILFKLLVKIHLKLEKMETRGIKGDKKVIR